MGSYSWNLSNALKGFGFFLFLFKLFSCGELDDNIDSSSHICALNMKVQLW